MMIPQGFGIIRAASRRTSWQGVRLFGPVIGLSAVLGPIVGGVLVDGDLLGRAGG